VERNHGTEGLVLFGILKKGVPVAEELANQIAEVTGNLLPVYPLDVVPFRDDRQGTVYDPVERLTDVTGKSVVLVDDVLHTGRTARAALDAVVRYGRPSSIRLVALVDRGHRREVPIRPDYVGRKLQTKYTERVVVDVENRFAIYQQE